MLTQTNNSTSKNYADTLSTKQQIKGNFEYDIITLGSNQNDFNSFANTFQYLSN